MTDRIIEDAAKALRAKRVAEGWLGLPPWQFYVPDVEVVFAVLADHPAPAALRVLNKFNPTPYAAEQQSAAGSWLNAQLNQIEPLRG